MCLGFDYEFSAIQNEDNELLKAYVEMFEVAVSQQSGGWRSTLGLYSPLLDKIFVSDYLVLLLIEISNTVPAKRHDPLCRQVPNRHRASSWQAYPRKEAKDGRG